MLIRNGPTRPTPTPTPAIYTPAAPLRAWFTPDTVSLPPSKHPPPVSQQASMRLPAAAQARGMAGNGQAAACGLVCAFEHDPDPHTHTHATATSHPNDRLCPLAAGSTYTRALVTRPIHTAHTAHSRRNYYPTRPRYTLCLRVMGPRASQTVGFGSSQSSHQPPAPTPARPSASWSPITISMPSVGMPRSARSSAA